MSTTTITSVPSLSQAVTGLLSTISAGDADGRLRVTGRSRHGFGERSLFLPAGPRDFIDGVLIALLEEDLWDLQVGAAVVDGESSALSRLGVLTATWRIARVFQNPEDSKQETGRQWITDEERVGAAYKRLDAFLPPTMLIDSAGHRLDAIWALGEPIDLRATSGVDRARELRRQLARAVGADAPAKDEDLAAASITIPGSAVREPPYNAVVTCLSLDAARVYSLDQLTAPRGAKGKQ